ncbi:hypothetical protein PPERSA_11365 [Pseudocohnilembus persalinus]|uniref:Uncharacterized protein n=1 Tax=Pseudocohnilembus persalinus TaxID=266149 RepID=A0A0V0QPY7_PSEPJ|nr:hypothetical protein PPERSA_11365 [Pseudocohnilembus persalinus]|eukprot:KRX04241.1 hypothetical protein PPERSA_11365 [Pseudocohnilembus persalinus]
MRMILEVPEVHIRQKFTWAYLFNQNFQSFSNYPMQVLAGSIPSKLNGSLIRNTSATFVRKNHQKAGHIYDGDGGIVKIDVQNQKANLTYQIIETDAYKKEQKANQYFLDSWGINKKGIFNKFVPNYQLKNTANASIFVPKDKSSILALGYFGLPYRLEFDTLKTIGQDDLDGVLSENETLGLKFRYDQQQNIYYNFGYIQNGMDTQINLYKFDVNGKVIEKKEHFLQSPRILVQDFCLAGDYIVMMRSPQYFNKTKWEQINYDSDEGTQFVVFNKNTLEFISDNQIDGFLVTEFMNGFQIKNNLVIDCLVGADFQYNLMLNSMTKERFDVNGNNQKLHRFVVNPQSGIVIDKKKISIYPSNQTTIHQQANGKPYKQGYMQINDMRKEFDMGNSIAKIDHKQDTIIYQQKNSSTFLGEPVLSQNGEFIFAFGTNTETKLNELHIMDSENLDQICVLGAEGQIPYSTKGVWVDNQI